MAAESGGIRLHVGAGKVYLRGFRNIDTPDSGAFLSDERKDIVERRITDEDRYYSVVDQIRQQQPPGENLRHHLLNSDPGPTVCDAYGSFERLPAADGECEMILARQVFEHLSRRESMQGLEECRRVLKIGGVLRLDVPDHDEAFAELRRLWWEGDETQAAFMLSHIIGSRNHHWAFHMGSWTRGDLRAFVESYGFEFDAEEPNIHFYPAFCLRWRKVAHDDKKHHPVHNLYEPKNRWPAAWAYCGEPLGTPLTVPDGWSVLEIGPGNQPWPRSTTFVDIVQRQLPNFILSDIENLSENDVPCHSFAFASHVLEHVKNPHRAAEELSRVAERGVIVCPSPFKEAIFNHHETDHKWFVLPAGKSGALRFLPINHDWVQRLRDPLGDGSEVGVNFSGVMHNLLRLPCVALATYGDVAKEFFEHAEPYLDVVHRWGPENPLRIEVLE